VVVIKKKEKGGRRGEGSAPKGVGGYGGERRGGKEG